MLTEAREIPAEPRGGGASTCAEHHPPPVALRRFARGELTSAEAKAVVRHLLHRCGSCAATAMQAWPGTKEERA